MIIYLAAFTEWATQSVKNYVAPVSKTHSLETASPQYAFVTDLWDILAGLDPWSATLERIFCLAHYLLMTGSYYQKIMQRTESYQTLREEATELILAYRPRTAAERKNLIFHAMLIVGTWKIGSVVQGPGLRLLENLMSRFPELRYREAFEVLMDMYPLVPAARAEWRNYWLQSHEQSHSPHVDLIFSGEEV